MISLNGESYELPYLFEAEYKDGTLYEQGSEDKSIQEEGKNAYYDIHYKPFKPEEDLVRFTLKGKHTLSVFLNDGHFEIDGVPVILHDIPVTEFRLIFYKTHRHNFNLAGQQLTHEIDFWVGWQTTFKGKNHEFKMKIN